MGVKPDFQGVRLYVDTNILIYAVEGARPEALALLEAVDAGVIAVVTSELTLAEVLVAPLRNGQQDIAATYEALLGCDESGRLDVVPVSRTVLMESARLRATVGGKLPDAIHVATALTEGCGFLLTEDRLLVVPDNLRKLTLEDLTEGEPNP